MKTRVVPHNTDCQHDRVVMRGDTLLICESLVAKVPRTAREVAAGSQPPGPSPLRQARDLHGLSLREVAAEIGIAFSYLRSVERGESEPGVSVAIRLARFYETTVEELFGDDERRAG